MPEGTLSAYLLDRNIETLTIPEDGLPIHVRRYQEGDHLVLHVYSASEPTGILILERGERNCLSPCLRLFTSTDGQLQAEWREGEQVWVGKLWSLPKPQELFKRHRGILASELLADKHVLIVGLGSVGSNVAVELAKAGVGRFTLCDHDRLESHNIVRHACTLADIGRLKTHAVADLLRARNPYVLANLIAADPFASESRRQELHAYLSQADLCICATDTLESRRLLNSLALVERKRVIFGMFTARALAGQVLRVRPYEGPCYVCAETQFGVEQPVHNSDVPYGGDEREAYALSGLSVDIMPVVQLMSKLALHELSAETPLSASLSEDFLSDCYLWINRREDQFQQLKPLGNGATSLAIQRWLPIDITINPTCPSCQEESFLRSLEQQADEE